MVRSNQFAAALDVLAGDEIGEAEDAPADAVARLGDGDVVASLRQLVCSRQAAEAAADDDDPAVSFTLTLLAESRLSLIRSAAAAPSERCSISRRVIPSGLP